MPLSKTMSHEDKVKELMQSYKDNGKIGNTTPKDEEDALKIANAIAYSNENLNFSVNNIGISMKEQLQKIKELIEEGFPVVEGAVLSQTKFDQEKETDTMQPENDKSFEDDRLNLEDVLNQSPNFKKNYVKRVVNTVNKLIDGTADIEDLKKVVKGKRKKCK